MVRWIKEVIHDAVFFQNKSFANLKKERWLKLRITFYLDNNLET